MKTYPLEIENIGDDVYKVMSRGHHDLSTFMAKVTEEYPSWPMGRPEHLWFKRVPFHDPDGAYDGWFHSVPEGTRGAFPATFCRESYGEARWVAATVASPPTTITV